MLDAVCREMEAYAAANRIPIIRPEAADFLADIVYYKRPELVLEIGTAIGYSTLLMAAKLPPGGRIISIEINAERAVLAQAFWRRAGLSDRIRVLVGDAGEILPTLAGPFELVFIDGPKGQYLDYLKKILDKLQLGAIVVADNVLFRGLVLTDAVPPRRFRTIVSRLRAYLAFVQRDWRFKTELVPVGDGMAISCYQGEKVK